MSEVTNYFGIDISKDVFDVCDPAGKHYQFSNNKKGFKSFYDLLDEQSHSTMEATGCYHLPLANFLNQVGLNVSVINPLVIKRFIQMRLRHTKTDKADAKMIKEYAKKEKPVIWAPKPAYMEACMENEGVVRLLLKHRTALKNKLHSLKSKGSENKLAIIILQSKSKTLPLK